MNHLTSKLSDDEDERPETAILDEAIQTVYDRPGKHGEPEDSFETIALLWNAYLNAAGSRRIHIKPSDVALMMVQMKLARAIEGEYNEDNFVDIAGYAEMAARLHNE